MTLIDHLLLMSLCRIRARAIRCLPISAGDTAIELGCGTGRNFPHLRSAIGSRGHLIGVEFSPGMFARTVGFARQERLDVELVKQDIARYRVPPADLVLLSLCYHTLEYPMQTLARIWDSLKPDACLAIIDGKQPNFAEKLILPFGERVLEAIFMGDADLRPWENLARLAPMQMKEFVFGAYYVCWAVKPESAITLLSPCVHEADLIPASVEKRPKCRTFFTQPPPKGARVVLESSLNRQIRAWISLKSRYGSSPPSA